MLGWIVLGWIGSDLVRFDWVGLLCGDALDGCAHLHAFAPGGGCLKGHACMQNYRGINPSTCIYTHLHACILLVMPINTRNAQKTVGAGYTSGRTFATHGVPKFG